MKFWKVHRIYDEIFYLIANFALKIQFKIFRKDIHRVLKRNELLKDVHKGKKVFILGNGPSLSDLDLPALKNEICFVVNRAYLHPEYAVLKPTYHVIIDSKLATGEWDLSMIDEILTLNPSVKLLLNSSWYNIDKFKRFTENENIFWLDTRLFFHSLIKKPSIDLTKITYGSAVVGQAITSAIYMGVNRIILLGVESNGFCGEILNQNTHFYGTNEDNKLKKIDNLIDDLYFNHLYLRNMSNIKRFVDGNKIEILNATGTGLLQMFNYTEIDKELQNYES